MNLKMFPNKVQSIKNIDGFFNEMRISLSENKTAIARQVGGRIPDNIFPVESSNGEKLRKNLATKGYVRFEKELTANFKLASSLS